ncbi:transposase, partial [Sciscionella marina]|uniref:transposase n=1 Tax=Sciscionella marina TaxID=508770 RepID=UPI00037E5DD1
SPAGLVRAAEWIVTRALGSRLVAVECVSSYGAGLARELGARGEHVCEVKPPKRADRAVHGKSDPIDPIDAIAAARAVLGTDTDELLNPRAEGLRSAMQVLLVARRAINSRRTADRNALNALVRTYNLGVDARKALTEAQVRTIARWRHRCTDAPAAATIREEARRLATAVLTATRELEQNRAALERHVDELMPGMLKIHAVGPITAATILTAWSHRGRLRSEAAFAALAGAAPLPASSGKTVRHRLSRSGDRQLNMALDVIARVRTSRDPATRKYVQRRTTEGRSHREIRRCLKRYIARQLYRQMTALSAQPAD